ncbi:hypothetical protein [Nitrobacter sp.]|uniref:hypothetical protein n=1 Tax=Nitrobacter sp. TaxID=29420 RepID=UPI0025EB7E51|nr:hypothetical protein [Nitrobacter sp.]
MKPALNPGEHAFSRRRDQPIEKAEQEQQNAANKIEMGVGRREGKVLLDSHGHSARHANQQKDDAHAHHQRSDHMLPSFPQNTMTPASGRNIQVQYPSLCDLKVSREASLAGPDSFASP